MNKLIFLFLLSIAFAFTGSAQNNATWKGKKCAVVLTYDDALNVDLTNAIPALDSIGLKATFYIANYNGELQSKITKWREAAAHGHELGNHTIYHPCEGGRARREFVQPENDMNNYTVRRMADEIKTMNILLTAIDGKTKRTFAYPCGDMKIHDTDYIAPLQNEFVAARGVTPAIELIDKINLFNVPAYGINGETGKQLIALVKEAQVKQGLLVFLFHGVGGGHGLNVSLQAHSELLHYLKQHQHEILIAPMVEVATLIKEHQQRSSNRKMFNCDAIILSK